MATDRIVDIMIGVDLGIAITIVFICAVALIILKKGERE